LECSFEFAGFDGPLHAVKVEALCDTLNARQPEVMNHWETPDRIKIIELAPSDKVVLPPLSVTAIEYDVTAAIPK
jgi:hypothetical protein